MGVHITVPVLVIIVVDSALGSRRFATREGRLEVASVADGAAGRRATDAGSSAAAGAGGPAEDVVEIVGCGSEGGAGRLWEAAVDSGAVRTGQMRAKGEGRAYPVSWMTLAMRPVHPHW